jgi:hypothetical protein
LHAQDDVLSNTGFVMSQTWINNKCQEWKLSMRASTTAAQKLPANWEEVVGALRQRVAIDVAKYNVPKVRQVTGLC